MNSGAHELQLQAGELRLAALQTGPESGRRVLALHGWMDNAASFQRLAPYLDRCRLVAVELPGHGLSDSGGDWFSYMDNLVVIHQARRALGWERCTLLGHSMGGGLAALYAAAYPDHVDRLISLDAYGPISGDDLLKQLRKAISARGERSAQRHFSTRSEAVAARANEHFPLDCAEVLADRGVIETAEGWTWRGDRRLKWPSLQRLTEDQVREALAAIGALHLLLRASQVLYPALEHVMQTRAKALAPSRKHVVQAGHHLHMEQPETCAELIADFLDSD